MEVDPGNGLARWVDHSFISISVLLKISRMYNIVLLVLVRLVCG